MGGRGYGGGGRGRVYAYLYTVTTRMTCIKMGSDESHFNVSLIVRDKVTRQCPQTTTFEEKGEPKRPVSTRSPSAYRLTARPNWGADGDVRQSGSGGQLIYKRPVTRTGVLTGVWLELKVEGSFMLKGSVMVRAGQVDI